MVDLVGTANGNKKSTEIDAAITEAKRLLVTVGGTAFKDVSELTEQQFAEVVRLGSRSLHLTAMAKAMQAINAIDPAELAKASPVAAATVAGILVDKAAGPLSVMAQVSRDDGQPLTFENVQQLMKSVRGRVKSLQAAGVRIVVEETPVRHAEPLPEDRDDS